MTVPLYSLTDTWNNAGTVFTAIQMNVTNTNSAVGSLLMDLQIGGVSRFNVTKSGQISSFANATDGSVFGSGVSNGSIFYVSNALGASYVLLGDSTGSSGPAILRFGSGADIEWRSTTRADSGGSDLALFRDAAGILAQRSSDAPTTAQTLRVYNTFTDASNYERGVFDWGTTSNTLTIGTQNAGTGTARKVAFVSGSQGFTFDSGIAVGGSALNSTDIRGPNAIRVGTNAANFYMLNSLLGLGGPIKWSSGADGDLNNGSSYDTGISRTAAASIAFGNSTQGDASATFVTKTKAGAVVAGDIPSGNWIVIRDTTNNTTKVYYNNAGTLLTVALV